VITVATGLRQRKSELTEAARATDQPSFGTEIGPHILGCAVFFVSDEETR
jgi:hypothetical protein